MKETSNDKKLITSLRDCTLQLLINRPTPITLEKISKETTLGTEWLKQFQNGKIKDPSASKIQTLYTFLTGQQLI